MQRLLLLGMLALFLQLAETAESEAGLVAGWSFDNCTAQDSSGRGLHGAINGTATCVAGIAGKALNFSGNSGYVEVPDDLRLSPLTSLTLEASVKPESLENLYSGIIYKQNSDGGGYSFQCYGDLGLQFSVTFEGDNGPRSFGVYDSDLIPLNQWSRVKVEVDTVAGKVRIFVNDVLKSEEVCPHSPMVLGHAPLRIGAGDLTLAPYGFYMNLNGAIDEVKISSNNALLTTTLTGTGQGAVNSIPSGIACTSASCSSYFASPDPVSLLATPDRNSVFSGWSGACTNSSGNCTVTMNASRDVGALFTTNLPVKLLGNPDRYYEDISGAYQTLTGGNVTVQARNVALTENAVLDLPVAVKLNGGYDSAFGAVVGKTVLSGKLMVRRGTLMVKNVVLASASSPVVSSTPADAATGVATATPIEVKMVRGIDAATVNSANVKLVGKGRFGLFNVPGQAGYDAALKVISLRTGGLPPGCAYTLTLSGLKDLSGTAVPDAVVTFSTRRNQLKKSVNYHSNGSVRGYSQATFESDGRPANRKDYPSAGPDGIWFTADDVLGYNESNSYNYSYATDKYTLSYIYGRYGNIGILSRSYVFDAGGNLTEEVYHGGSDAGYSGFGYDARGYLREATRYLYRYEQNSPVVSYTVSVYDPQGNKTQDISYNSCSTDGIPLPNDEVARYVSYALNGQGRLGRIITHDDAGPDAVWFTADDGISGYWDLTYSASGPMTRAVYHGHPGTDGIWLTADDLLLAYLSYHYDAAGNRTESIRYLAPGADGVWFTADDTKSAVDTYDTTW